MVTVSEMIVGSAIAYLACRLELGVADNMRGAGGQGATNGNIEVVAGSDYLNTSDRILTE